MLVRDFPDVTHPLSAILDHFAVARDPRGLGNEDQVPAVIEELERLVLSSAFIFVVDSQRERIEAGCEQLQLLRTDLGRRAIDLDKLPVVFQLNKRDLPNVCPAADLQEIFKTDCCRYVESTAARGQGVVEAFEMVLTMLGK